MAEVEPQFASDYDDRTTVSVRSVLVEIGQVLGSYQGKFAVIGGTAPWLLLSEADIPHMGTLDVDLTLDAEALGDGETSEKFRHLDDFGPTSVRQFVDRPDVLGERTADQWQQDAFGQVNAWLSASGLR